MQTLMTIAGIVLLACGCVAIAAAFVIYAMDAINKTYMSIFKDGREAGRKDSLADIDMDACWFSEDPPTMLLLRDYASGRYSVSDLRERWRRYRKTAEQMEQERKATADGKDGAQP